MKDITVLLSNDYTMKPKNRDYGRTEFPQS